eukprot:gb/GECG01015347.1/.p1 GENE.gb/GECG01015347.1/~~gb/GECG01015347.1/.p1  ORF type:complete len:328 (+),score=24.24 gb/GECG01015347.1/:1-984(+)
MSSVLEKAGSPDNQPVPRDALMGMKAIVTGANSGLGYCTARELVRRGATVVLACRDLNKAQEAADAINSMETIGHASCIELDLADLNSVTNFVTAYLHQHDTCNILVNNAGLNTLGNRDAKTKQGFELCFGVNFLGHFHLTELLLDTLKKSGTKENPSKVVNVSSVMHRMANPNPDEVAYAGRADSYGSSKLYQIQHAIHLQRKAESEGWNLKALSVHPGSVNSNIWRTFPSMVLSIARPVFNVCFLSNEQGAYTSICAATDPKLQGGEYLVPYWCPSCCSRCQPCFEFIGVFQGARSVKPSGAAADTRKADVLAEFSARLVKQAVM